MLIKHRGIEPYIDPSAYIAPTATIIGNVTIGAKTKVMFGAIINSEGSKVTIGETTIISENAVIRAASTGTKEHFISIGKNVFIGPHTTILGAILEPCCYIATSVTVLQGAKICSGSVVAVGALVHANAVIPQDFFVPPHTIAIGDPVQVYSPHEKEKIVTAITSMGFSKVAFNVDATGKMRAEVYREITEVRSDEYEEHLSDKIIQHN